MNKGKLFPLIGLFLFVFSAQHSIAQTHSHVDYCTAHSYEMSLDPALRAKKERILQQSLEAHAQKSGQKSGTYIVPTVIHVVHNGGAENISYAQILDAMRQLNEDFQKLNADTAQVASSFKGIIGDANIEFRLARLDPSGQCTDGVTRTKSALTTGANDNVKSLIGWPKNKYFNVWVVKSINTGSGTGVGGYAYRPGFIASPAHINDGVVIRHTQFGTIGTANGGGLSDRTFSHEAGHWLGLKHPWGGTNNPGLASNCTIDDDINDTPNTVGNTFNCNRSRVSCSSLDNVENIMDYGSCPKMFTQGQAALMRNIISTNVSFRGDLVSNSNLWATGTHDNYGATACRPELRELIVSDYQICEGETVGLRALISDVNPDSVDYSWTLPGTVLSNYTVKNPQVSYSQAGSYDVIVELTSSGGTTKDTIKDAINVLGAGAVPYLEEFADTTWPQNTNSGYSWARDPYVNSSKNWEQFFGIGYNDLYSLRIDCFGPSNGTERDVVLPPFDMSDNQNPPILRFKYSYGKRQTNNADVLTIYQSFDCGATYSPLFLDEIDLGDNAVSGLYNNFDYAPTSQSKWTTHEVQLPSTYKNFDQYVLKFTLRTEGGGGNYLYIDSLYFGEPGDINSVSTKKKLDPSTLNLFPNPSKRLFTIQGEFPERGKAQIQIQNLSGQTVYSKENISSQSLASGLQIAPELPAGVYYLQLKTLQGTINKRLIVNR